MKTIGVIGIIYGYTGVMYGLYWDNGKSMETTIWGLGFRVSD